jgi:antitoxin MazE
LSSLKSIPTPFVTQLGLNRDAGVKRTIEDDAPVLRQPANPVRNGWAEAAGKIADAGDDTLVIAEFANSADTELVW